MYHKSIYLLIVLVFTMDVIESIAAPFLPLLLDQHGINEIWCGVIFTSLSLAKTAASPVVGYWMQTIGHRAALCIGTPMMAVSVAGFGMASFAPTRASMISFFVVSRLFHGISSALVGTATYAYGAKSYPEKADTIISMLEAATGMGLIFGPMIGTLVYPTTGFCVLFLSGSILLLPLAVAIYFVFPTDGHSFVHEDLDTAPFVNDTDETVDKHSKLESKNMLNEEPTPQSQDGRSPLNQLEAKPRNEDSRDLEITHVKLLLNWRVILGATCSSLCFFVYTQLEPTLAIRLRQDYGLNETASGLLFSLPAVMYVVGALMLPYLRRGFKARRVLTLNLMLLAFAQMLVAPFFTDINLMAMCIGLALTGLHLGPLTVLSLPEMIDATKDKYPGCSMDHAIDMLSGIANSAMGIGASIGPLYGASMLMNVGFRYLFVTTASLLFSLASFAAAVDQSQQWRTCH